MSIRILTRDLFSEAGEAKRREVIKRHVAPVASDSDGGVKRTSGGSSDKRTVPKPDPQVVRDYQPTEHTKHSIAARPKKREDRWGIPGGIKARFGRGGQVAEGKPQKEEPDKVQEADESDEKDESSEVYSIDIELQTNLHDFILRNCEKAKLDENIIENVTLAFHKGQGTLPVAKFPGWTDDLNLSPTAGMYPEPGEQWICTVDAAGLIYPIEKIQ